MANRKVIQNGKKIKLGMLTADFFDKWVSAFAAKVDPKIISEFITAKGCYPWHIFTWGNVECVKGEKAIAAYKKTDPKADIYFYCGYDFKDDRVERSKNNIEEFTFNIEEKGEFYVTSRDFSWTFVWTHESYLFGPYFCTKNNLAVK